MYNMYHPFDPVGIQVSSTACTTCTDPSILSATVGLNPIVGTRDPYVKAFNAGVTCTNQLLSAPRKRRGEDVRGKEGEMKKKFQGSAVNASWD